MPIWCYLSFPKRATKSNTSGDGPYTNLSGDSAKCGAKAAVGRHVAIRCTLDSTVVSLPSALGGGKVNQKTLA